MPCVSVVTEIHVPAERCSDLCRHVDLNERMALKALLGLRSGRVLTPMADGTRVRDWAEWASPAGLGAFVNRLFLERYVRRCLTARSRSLKALAEKADQEPI